ncbi:hypothetical protein BDZ45DRAFT_694815 [Acephala macrosclerotiorum]|nr:hypothetical protein BDZ45DRAFT_694815 [Acephala macrosclerotiorum]
MSGTIIHDGLSVQLYHTDELNIRIQLLTIEGAFDRFDRREQNSREQHLTASRSKQEANIKELDVRLEKESSARYDIDGENRALREMIYAAYRGETVNMSHLERALGVQRSARMEAERVQERNIKEGTDKRYEGKLRKIEKRFSEVQQAAKKKIADRSVTYSPNLGKNQKDIAALKRLVKTLEGGGESGTEAVVGVEKKQKAANAMEVALEPETAKRPSWRFKRCQMFQMTRDISWRERQK